MKYWIACLLIFVSVLAHADSLEEIRAKIAWIATEFEQGKLTEKEALYESEAVSLRIEKLESQAAMKPSNATPILIQKVPEYTGNALLRQAAMPSITAPLYESSKSGFMTIFMRVFPYMVGLLLLTCLGGIALAFGYGGSFSDYFRERVSNHTAIIDSIDRGPTLASVMGQARAQGVIPQQLRTPQGVSPAPVNALVVRRPRRNTPHHSGEISIWTSTARKHHSIHYERIFMSYDSLPDWVKRNPKSNLDRLQREAKMLYEQFPHIGIYRLGETLYLEGPVLSMSDNMYLLRIVYPETYPYQKPEAFVRDDDVIEFCKKKSSHDFHHYGHNQIHGLNLCVMGANDTVNKGWTPNQTGVTILEYAIMWLHGYEVKRVRGKWPLPE